jgi:hypothetical protein
MCTKLVSVIYSFGGSGLFWSERNSTSAKIRVRLESSSRSIILDILTKKQRVKNLVTSSLRIQNVIL